MIGPSMNTKRATCANSAAVPVRRGAASTALALTLSALVPAFGVLGVGCRVDDQAVHRWETTERGPDKLVAVLTHDKYDLPLRIEAALSLIRMRPRNGRRVGTELMTDALSALPGGPNDSRAKIVDGMTPELIKQIEAPPPPRSTTGALPEDHSIPFKDAAFALLQHDPPLVSTEATKTALGGALTQWCQADFETRLENPSQQFGIEQIMRFLGPSSVSGLPALINEQSNKVDRVIGLIADLGDPATKQKASDNLVALGKAIDSKAWIDKQTVVVQKADDDQKQKVTKEQLQTQVMKYQDQELTKVFSSMKRIKGRSVVEYLIAYASNPQNSAERRKTALAALEGGVDKNNAADIERIFTIAKDDSTPDDVRDQAFNRLGELPKEQVVPRLYTLFTAKKWKVRWVAASQVLRMITPKQIPEFMSHLPTTPSVKMGEGEVLAYGGALQKMESPAGEPKARDVVMGYLGTTAVGPKLTALSFFYQGKKADVPVVVAKEGDSQAVPKCDAADECTWQCELPKPGTAPDKGETEMKTVVTVGDFARDCIAPHMDTP
jgi:hypothetical protein